MPISVFRARGAVLPALLLLAAACKDGGTEPPPQPGTPGIHFISGAAGEDSIDAALPDLVLEVRGQDGAPAAGVAVQFSVSRGIQGDIPLVYLSGPGQMALVSATVNTDAQGRASSHIRLGTAAAPAEVFVSVPSLGYQDTARYTVRPGAATDVQISPADTAVYAGAQYALRASASDRNGNSRVEALTYQHTLAGVATASGATVQAVAVGRGGVVVRAGTVADTAWVSVVPHGTLAVRRVAPGATQKVWLMNLDGSGMQAIPTPGQPSWGEQRQSLDWSPGGAELAFYGEGGTHQLYAATPAGAVRPLVALQGTLLQRQPAFSRDGAWIFYQVGRAESYNTTLWRARADGTGREQLSPSTPEFYTNDIDPSPSPDGTQVVYATDRERGWGISPPHRLVVMNLATREVRGLGVLGNGPRWSPNADLIAFERDRRLWVVRADGTGERALTPPNVDYEGRVTWSPDGQWIAATRGGGPFIHLVRVDTGLTLPLAFTGYFVDPAWKP